MPTYDFTCPSGHRFEKFYRKISEGVAILACPECGLQAERQLSAGAGFIFKGSGFYITDYGKDGKKPPAGRASDGAGKGESSEKKNEAAGGAKEGSSSANASGEGGSKPPGSAKSGKDSSSGGSGSSSDGKSGE